MQLLGVSFLQHKLQVSLNVSIKYILNLFKMNEKVWISETGFFNQENWPKKCHVIAILTGIADNTVQDQVWSTIIYFWYGQPSFI